MELGLQNSALARTSDLGTIMSKMTMKSTHTRLAYVLMASVAMPTFAIAQQIKIEEIVVTARKRDESLLEIPLSVSAFSQEMLDRAGIDKVRGTFELLMDSGEAEGRRNWMREHWKTVEADV